jgi:CDP-4-dehydro-6-deoxyglucose reductase, E1
MNWPLTSDSFSFFDKLKICYWLLTEDKWTQGDWVRKYEYLWEDYLKCKSFATMVSSGSTANELIALRKKWELEKEGNWPRKNKVIVSSTTWISNISPFINIGFEPVFVDIDLDSLCADISQIEILLSNDLDKKIGVVNYTTLVGKSGDIEYLVELCKKYEVKLILDNCESSFSEYYDKGNFSNFATSSTSIYFSHLTTSGTEGGLIFCKDKEESDWYKMMRSHGMTRGMPDIYKNKEVDPMFDFCYMGSNYRSSNLQAYMALLNFHKSIKFIDNRKKLAYMFEFCYKCMDLFSTKDNKNLNISKIGYLYSENSGEVPFCLLYISKNEEILKKLKTVFDKYNIEYRPIIGGNLLRQTAFKKYGLDPTVFSNSEYIHKHGLYIGLHSKVTMKMISKLSTIIEEINV